ncbi:MAG: DUF4178 domain-containing protein [Myxococcota bacterium]
MWQREPTRFEALPDDIDEAKAPTNPPNPRMSIVIAALMTIIVGTTGGAAYLLARQYHKEHRQKRLLGTVTATRHPLNLQINDVVIHMDAEYLVEGRVTFEESGQRWFAYRLTDGSTVRWMRARPGDAVEITLFEEIEPLTEEARPPESLTWQETNFKLKGWGQARIELHGQHTRLAAARCEYHDYRGFGDRVLSIELWGPSQTVTLVGRHLDIDQLEFMPGDHVS